MSVVDKKDKTPLLLKFVAWVFPKLESVAPWLAKKWFTRIFFRPIKYKRPQAELEIEKEAKHIDLTFNNKKVKVYEWGMGEPVLFVHGWMSRGTQFRKFVEPFNDAGYQVIAFDAPAHGNSEGLKTDILEFRDIILELANNYSFKAVIGHSIGGASSMHALLIERFTDKLVMIGSPSMADKIIGEFQRRLNASDAIKEHFYKYVEEKYEKSFHELSASYIVKDLKDVELLLIHDEDDIEVTLDNAQKLSELYSNSKLIVTKGLGHTRILKDEKVINYCLNFLEEDSLVHK